MSTENEAVVRRFYAEVLNEGNVDVCDEIVASYMVDNVIRPKDPVGLEGYKQAIKVIRSGMPDFEATIDDMFSDGGKVAVLWTFRGTHSGELMGIAPSGKQVAVTGMYMYVVEDGKIVERFGAGDMLSLMRQIGAFPA